MKKVVIIINAEINEQGQLFAVSPVTQKMVEALKQSIADDSDSTMVEVISAAALWSNSFKPTVEDTSLIYCPLTIQLPEYFDFSARQTYIACKNIGERRLWVEKLGFKTSVGDSWLGHLWLPIILTPERTIYGDIIGEGEMPNSYEQPVEISLRHYKSLHNLADELLYSLSAPPAVYLLQFSLYGGEIVFDRFWPFPAAPALASLRTQQPDLFACHWRCLTGRTIPELNLSGRDYSTVKVTRPN